MTLTLDGQTLALLFGAAIIAGFLDTLAGGGGLITLPALLVMQVPLLNALATNRLQASFGTLTAVASLARRGVLQVRNSSAIFIASLCGSAIGTIAVLLSDPARLKYLVPAVLIFIALYFLLMPINMSKTSRERIGQSAYERFVLPLIGAYCGGLGPGAGSFFALSAVALRGRDIVTATAWAKVADFGANLASLAVFIAGGKVLWLAGAVMIAGQIAGSYMGSIAVVTGGTILIRPLVVVMSVGMLLRYLYEG